MRKFNHVLRRTGMWTILSFILIEAQSCSNNPDTKECTLYYPDPSMSRDNRTVTSDSVVFLGDSFTHMSVWQDNFSDIETSNQGIGGNKTRDVLKRLNDAIASQPQKLFLLIGTNDLLAQVPIPVIVRNIDSILQKITTESPNTIVYLESVFPVGQDRGKKLKQKVIQINQMIFNLAIIYHLQYIDVHSALVDKNGYLKSEYTCDNVHLTEPGFKVWTAYIRPYIYR